jgi:hypothetical protein
MNKIQKVNFKTIDDFLDYLPEPELKLVNILQQIVLKAIPECTEKLAYNVPFYYKHRRICYIWPASMPWGGITEGVALGFCRGNQLVNPDFYLSGEENKVIRSKTFRFAAEIDTDLLRDFLFEAAILDEQFKKNLKQR